MTSRAYSIRGWGRTEFSPEVIEMMRGAVERSEKMECEIGFLLCKCFGRITSSKEIAIGSHTEIPREKLLATTCPRGCEPIGYFHTHPSTHPGGIPHPTAADIRVGVYELLPIVCVGTVRKIVCYKIPEEIIKYRRKEKEYGEESEKVLKELMQKGYSPDDAMKHPKYDALVGKMFHYTRLYWNSMNDFAEAVERQDRLTLRRYGKYGEPFLEVAW